jgi:transcriptional regulator with PAS, ATPase and Fis domain
VPLALSDDLHARLRAYHYPGNIRELWNLMQQISVLGEDEDELPRRLMATTPRVEPRTDPPERTADPGPEPGQSLRDAVAEYELRIIEEAIRSHGSKRKAAAALGVDIGTISRKTRKEP